MARQWNNGKNGTKYTTVSAVYVPASGDKKPYWQIGFTYSSNKFCSVRLYNESTYEPNQGRHKGKKCCVANVNMGSLSSSGSGSNYPN